MDIACLQTIPIIVVALYCARILMSHILTWFYFARYDRLYPSAGYAPPVSIIKPIWGLDELALTNFRSFCEQDYANDYELLFCVENQGDATIPLIKKLIEEYPGRNIRLVFSDPQDTRSAGKIKNMIVGFSESQYDVIIFSDSDVHVPPTFLKDTVACVESVEVGLGFSAPVLEGSEDWVAAMLNIAGTETVIGVVPLCQYGPCTGAVGTTMVTRREVIVEIGGLEQFGHYVTEDVPLARAIHKKGYLIRVLKQPVRVYHLRDNFVRWWWHMHRWLVIIRHYFPMAVFLAPLTELPLLWSLMYLVLSLFRIGSTSVAVFLVAAVLIVRLISTTVINMKFVQDKMLWRFLWVVPILDLLRPPLLVHSFLTNHIVWRGRRVHVDSDCTATYFEARR